MAKEAPTSGTQAPPFGALTVSEGAKLLTELDDVDQPEGDKPAGEVEPEGDEAPDGEEPKGDEEPEGEPEGEGDAEPEGEKPEGGEEPEPEGDEEPEPDRPQTFTVRVDGKDEEVPADELVRGYQRQSDYTRKTMEAAELRRQAEAEQKTARETRERYATELDKILTIVKASEQEPDWEKVKAEDPEGYPTRHADWQRRVKARQQLEERLQGVESERAAEAEKAKGTRVAQEREKLEQAVPEFRDRAKARELTKQLATYAVGLGVTPDEFEDISDHRLIIALRKAMLYDEIQTRKKQAVGKGKQTKSPTLKPGARDTTPSATRRAQRVREEAEARLRKTGSIRDAVTALMDLKD